MPSPQIAHLSPALSVGGAQASADVPSYGLWRAWWALGIMSIQMVLVGADYSIVSLLVAPIEHAFHIDDVIYAVITATAISVGYALFSYPMGLLADSFGRRNMIVMGCFVWGVAALIAVFANVPAVFFCARFIAGIGTVFMGVAMYPLLYDAFPIRQRALANGTFASTSAVGWGLGLTMCGALVDATRHYGAVRFWNIVIAPWQECFIAVAAGGFFSGLIMMTVRQPPQRDVVERKPDVQETMRGFSRYMRRHYVLWAAFFLAFASTYTLVVGVQAWAPAFAERRFGLSDVALTAVLGTMSSGGALVGAAGGGLIAQVMINTGQSRLLPNLLIGLTVLEGVFLAGFPYAGSWTLAALAIGAGLAASGAAQVLINIAIQEAGPNEVRSQLFGISCCVGSLPGMFAPAVVAFVAGTLFARSGGLGPAFTFVGSLASIVAIGLFQLSKRPYTEATAAR